MPRLPRFLALLSVLALACSPGVGATEMPPQGVKFDSTAVLQITGRAAAEIRAAYVYPDKGESAAGAIERAAAANSYAAIEDPGQLALRLTSDLQSVIHDAHMRVIRIPLPNQAGSSQAPASPPASKGGFERVDRLRGNIGYIRLARFIPLANFREVANSAMQLVAGSDALIIDMRGNGGGDPASVAYLCGFFFDPARPVQVNDIVWRERGTASFRVDTFWTEPTPVQYLDRPVYILAGPQTFSGGEEFVYDMKVLRRATVVGATTKGGANPAGIFPIGGGLGIVVPTGRAENPVTKSNWEGSGVEPDEQ